VTKIHLTVVGVSRDLKSAFTLLHNRLPDFKVPFYSPESAAVVDLPLKLFAIGRWQKRAILLISASKPRDSISGHCSGGCVES